MARSTLIALLQVAALYTCFACTNGGSAAAPGTAQRAAASQYNQSGAAVEFTSLNTAIEAALADASRRTGLSRTALELVSAQAVTWPDGSLGCPQPGMSYTQALVPGYRIHVRAATQEFDYHAGTRGAPVLCPPGRAVDPVVDPGRT